MKKLGFTLAEVLITLMILGVIAAMTVPTLIQDTQKKEQVVQVKKGLSMINQAITMNYALEQETLSDINTAAELSAMLKKRLTVVDSAANWVRTADGLTYYFTPCTGAATFNSANDISNTNCIFNIVISTKADVPAETASPSALGDGNKTIEIATTAESGVTGFYQFYSGDDRIVPSEKTQEFLTLKNLKTFKGGTTPTTPSTSEPTTDPTETTD